MVKSLECTGSEGLLHMLCNRTTSTVHVWLQALLPTPPLSYPHVSCSYLYYQMKAKSQKII